MVISFVALGIIAIISAFLQKPSFKIHVVGRDPLTISGKQESIISIIRQYKEAVDTNQ